jgi:hypothetical protein
MRIIEAVAAVGDEVELEQINQLQTGQVATVE